jgi:polysaccharide export outer membrane protein
MASLIRKLVFLLIPLALFSAGLTRANAQEAAAPPPVVTQTANPTAANYVLGAGDKVRVIVFGEQQLSGEFYVSPQGIISYPLVGDIQAAGRTVPEIIGELTTRLKDGVMNEPRVSAEVLSYRPFYILGEVTKPGTYPYTSEMTVMNAVATAGGFTYRANKGSVFIKHVGEAGEKKIKLTADTMVAPGDTVRIAERIF